MSVSVLHIRSAASRAAFVPAWRRLNQPFATACMLFRSLSWVSQKLRAFSFSEAEIAEVGRNILCMDLHCSVKSTFSIGAPRIGLQSSPPVYLELARRRAHRNDVVLNAFKFYCSVRGTGVDIPTHMSAFGRSSLLLTQSGHHLMHCVCPLLGADIPLKYLADYHNDEASYT